MLNSTLTLPVLRLGPWQLLLGGLLFFLGLGAFPIYIVDEARNAQAAWEMLRAGEWIVPTFNGTLRADKPPLHYYGMRLGYLLLGKNALAARLASGLCGLVTMLVIYKFTTRYANRTAGLLAALLFPVGIYVPVQFHLATPDPYLCCFFTLAQCSLFRGYLDRSRGWLALGYLSLGLAVLAKGPVALVLTAGGWAFFLLGRPLKLWTNLRAMRLLLGVVLLLLLVVPWFYLVDQRTDGRFTEVFFWEHNANRFLETKEGHGGSPLLVPALAVAALLPFAFWLPQGILRVWRRADEAMRLALSLAGFVVVFFMFSQTKLPSYPFPAVPFFAIVLGSYLARYWRKKPPSRGDQISFHAAGLLLLALPAGVWFGLEADPLLRDLSSSWWHLTALAVPALAALFFWHRAQTTRALGALWSGFWLFQVYVLLWLLPQIGQRSQVTAALPLLREAPEFIALGRFAPAFVYELDRRIESVDSSRQLRDYLAEAPDGTLILTAERYRDRLPAELDLRPVFRQKDLFEYPTTLIFRYHAR